MELQSAAVMWTLVGVIAVSGVVTRIRSTFDTLTVADRCARGSTPHSFPARVVWSQGQIVWILTLIVTEAWIAARAGRMRAAGLWLAAAIALKPILALFPLALGWTILMIAAIAVAASPPSSLLSPVRNRGWTGSRSTWLGARQCCATSGSCKCRPALRREIGRPEAALV